MSASCDLFKDLFKKISFSLGDYIFFPHMEMAAVQCALEAAERLTDCEFIRPPTVTARCPETYMDFKVKCVASGVNRLLRRLLRWQKEFGLEQKWWTEEGGEAIAEVKGFLAWSVYPIHSIRTAAALGRGLARHGLGVWPACPSDNCPSVLGRDGKIHVDPQSIVWRENKAEGEFTGYSVVFKARTYVLCGFSRGHGLPTNPPASNAGAHGRSGYDKPTIEAEPTWCPETGETRPFRVRICLRANRSDFAPGVFKGSKREQREQMVSEMKTVVDAELKQHQSNLNCTGDCETHWEKPLPPAKDVGGGGGEATVCVTTWRKCEALAADDEVKTPPKEGHGYLPPGDSGGRDGYIRHAPNGGENWLPPWSIAEALTPGRIFDSAVDPSYLDVPKFDGELLDSDFRHGAEF
jgi:hypothetical protein